MPHALVLSDTRIEFIKKFTLWLLEKLDDYETEVVAIGKLEHDAINLIKKYKVKRITLLHGESIQTYSPETYTKALHNFIKNNTFDVIFSGSTSISRDVFPRLSAIYATGLASGVKDFFFKDERLIGIKEIYGGRCLTDIEIPGPKPWFMTTRPSVVNTSSRVISHACEIVDCKVPDCEIHAHVSRLKKNTSKRPPLENADIVVAGGRGIGDETKLKILEELADTLGAALGASGGAIGNGFAPQEYLVGQTGTQISPLLYIACGISGATQHLAGIRNAKHILSINSDANAPLMKIADYAIVGDLHEIVPALTQHLIAKKKNA